MLIVVTTITVVWIGNANSLARRGLFQENVTGKEIPTAPPADTAKSLETLVSIPTRTVKTHQSKKNVAKTEVQPHLLSPTAISLMFNIHSPQAVFPSFTSNGPQHPVGTMKRSSCRSATTNPTFPTTEAQNGMPSSKIKRSSACTPIHSLKIGYTTLPPTKKFTTLATGAKISLKWTVPMVFLSPI